MATAEDLTEDSDTYILDDEPEARKKTSFRPRRQITPVKSLLRHNKLALLSFILVALAAEPVLYFRSLRPLYRAESLLMIAPIMLKNVIEDREYQVPRYDELVNEQLALIVREEVSTDALQRLKDDASLWARPGESRREAATRLSQTLLAKRMPDSTYISVSLEASDPKGLAKVVNAVVEAYLSRVKGKGFYGQEVREDTLRQRQQELKDEVAKKTERLTRWAKELGVANFDKPIDMSSLETKALFDARSLRLAAESKLEAMKARQDALRQTDLSNEVRDMLFTDPEMLNMRSVLLPKRNELKTKALGLTPDHEGRKELERQINEINQDLERSEKSATVRLRATLQQKRETQMRNELDAGLADVEQAKRFELSVDQETRIQNAKLAKFNEAYYEAVNVKQDVDRLNRQLSALEDRLDAMRLEAQGPGLVALVSEARTPEKPVSRSIGTLLMVFGLLAVFMAFAVPSLVDAVDHRIQSPLDVEAAIGARALGWVLERSARSENFANDQIRRIALSLERQRRINQRGLISFMSLRPKGGTTQLVLDLARELRGIGCRVIVVEANALHPDGSYLVPRGHPGLMGVLAGKLRVEESVLPPQKLLSYRIPIGNTEGSPLLVNSRNLRAVLNHLSSVYDMVLVDAPPLFVSSDAELIASCSQGVILVVEAGRVVTGEMKRATDIVHEIGPLMVEVVVNRVRDYRGHGYYSKLVEQYESAGRPRSS
jgi:uncharacterized protein involved in exopolysaccharide biosynthesis/Mrp family chromosome partitioning ATPase